MVVHYFMFSHNLWKFHWIQTVSSIICRTAIFHSTEWKNFTIILLSSDTCVTKQSIIMSHFSLNNFWFMYLMHIIWVAAAHVLMHATNLSFQIVGLLAYPHILRKPVVFGLKQPQIWWNISRLYIFIFCLFFNILHSENLCFNFSSNEWNNAVVIYHKRFSAIV